MEPKLGRAPTRAPGTSRGTTHGCSYCVGLQSGGICWALAAVALPSSPPPRDPWAPRSRSLDPVSPGSCRPGPTATGTRGASFPRGKAKVAGGRGVARGHPVLLACLHGQADLPWSWEPRVQGPRRCATPVLPATRTAPKSLSLGREWGSAEAPGDAGEGRGAPLCSRRGSPHHAGDRSFVARTPAGRPALLPHYPLLCSCPACKTQLGTGGKDC